MMKKTLSKEEWKDLKHLLWMIGNVRSSDWLNWKVVQERTKKYEKML